MLIDVACPYGSYLNELHDRKQSEVNFEINKVFRCEVLLSVVGSTRL